VATLVDLKQGESGTIAKVRGRGAFRKRITEMGFIKGKQVTVIKAAPLQDPIEYKIMGYNVSLRRSEAGLILMANGEKHEAVLTEGLHAGERLTFSRNTLNHDTGERGKTIEIALVGNPNCGKTTLFNIASGSHERVGNFGGVTVDSKSAKFRQQGYLFNITDLPGTYSLTAYSPEELFVRRFLLQEVPDIVVNVVDASNLERNLYLTTQLIDMDLRVVMALNMYDEFTAQGHKLKLKTLEKLLGIPIIPTVSSRGTGITELFSRIIEVFEDRDPVTRHVHINYGEEIERSVDALQRVLRDDKPLTDRISSRYLGLKILEKDEDLMKQMEGSPVRQKFLTASVREIDRLEKSFSEDSATLVTDARYGFIAGALRETLTPNIRNVPQRTTSETIDRILTHKYLGFPVFLLFLWIMFESTFILGKYPQHWIDLFVGQIGGSVSTLMPDGPLKDLLVGGIITGVGSVIVFLPNILILFAFISIMEDSGYMARAAFIMDRLMHMMGLHGQSFIPLIMGFGCNVPAIMTTRTLRNKKDRLATMLVNPLMSCSARLTVYILITGAIFPKHAGTVIFSIYMFGILLAVLASLIFKKTLFKSKEAPFVMELPPYRMPTGKVIFRHMWEKGQQYLRKMGGVILIAVIIIWALEYFPAGSKATPHERLEKSYIGMIGRTIEPVMAPLGFDWRMGVSVITGAAAKEVVVSTMGVLYGSADPANDTKPENLSTILQKERYSDGPRKGELVFTPVAGISFLVFILIYMPCVAVIATVNRESGNWKWALFLVTYTTALAWLLSFGVYQVGSLFFAS
jgi:ferrous iron transport protein B